MFGSEQREQKRQFAQSIEESQNANDNEIMKLMNDPSRVAYDPQVSAMLLEVRDRFLKWEIEQKQSPDGKILSYLVNKEKFQDYKEPYGEESLAFMEGYEEKQLLNQFGMTLSQVKKFADKNDLNWSLAFNEMVRKRTDFLLNSRTTGKGSHLAKSQITQSTSSIKREMGMQKKKGFFDGLFG